jgi:hypothetical protein
MYIDEPWYMEMAKNMNQGKGPVVCEYSPEEDCFLPLKPPAWPFMISLVQRVKLGSDLPLYLSSAIGILSIVAIFLLAAKLFGEKEGVIAALLLGVSGLHILWSNSAETNAFSLFVAILATLAFLLYLERKDLSVLMLFALLSILMVLSRFELIFYMAALLLLIFKSEIIALAYISALVIFQPFAYTLLRSEPGYSSYILNLQFLGFPWVVLLLAAYSLFSQNRKAVQLFVLLLASLAIYVPLLNEKEARMALLPLALAIMLASHSVILLRTHLSKYAYLAALLLLAIFLGNTYDTYSMIPVRYAPHIEETNAVKAIDIAPGSYVVAAYPSVVSSVSDAKGVSIEDAGKLPGEYYFFFDSFCTGRKVALSPNSDEKCRQFLSENSLSPVKKLSPHYNLYFSGIS